MMEINMEVMQRRSTLRSNESNYFSLSPSLCLMNRADSWRGSDNIIRLVENYRRNVNYFNKVNISSPFTCLSGMDSENYPLKLKKTSNISACERIENNESREESLIKNGKATIKTEGLDYNFNKTVRFDKPKIFRTDLKKKQYLFGIRQIKGVMFREKKKPPLKMR